MITSYAHFVGMKCKPGAQIKEGLTPSSAHMLHMAVGLMGETVEYIVGVSNQDAENCKEELGDMLFYLQGLCNGAGVEINLPRKYDGSLEDLNSGLVYASNILDLVKKYAIYEKDYSTIHEKLVWTLDTMACIISSLAEDLGVTVQEVIEANMAKLDERYKKGYSNQEAIERADKPEGE